jgi:hypothetical protein
LKSSEVSGRRHSTRQPATRIDKRRFLLRAAISSCQPNNAGCMRPPSASSTCVSSVARRGRTGSRDTASNDLSFQTASSSVPTAAGFPRAPPQPRFHARKSSRTLLLCPCPHVLILPLPNSRLSLCTLLSMVQERPRQKMRRAAHTPARRHSFRGLLHHTSMPQYPVVDFLPSPLPPVAAASEPRHPRPPAVRRSCESSLLLISARRRKMRPAPPKCPGRCSYRTLE